MFSISFLPLFALFLRMVIAFDITAQTQIDEFPIQVPNFNNEHSFFRIRNRTEKEEWLCPKNYVFDRNVNHCVRQKDHICGLECEELRLSDGDYRNQDNCQTFYNCGKQCCYLMPCPDGLLFHSSGHCEYPTEAECCEYPEKNANQYVQLD